MKHVERQLSKLHKVDALVGATDANCFCNSQILLRSSTML